MKTIYKYEINAVDMVYIDMPKCAKVLTLQIQNGTPMIWALVDNKNETEQRVFDIIGTGHSVPDLNGFRREYINTFQLHGGSLVFHLFELVKERQKELV